MQVSRGFVVLLLLLAQRPSLVAGDQDPKPAPSIEVGKDAIEFKVGKDLVTRYVITARASKPYFYPLYALPGKKITENGPLDHVHHRSVWFCHGDVVPEGIEFKKHFKGVAGIDFWSERRGAGKIVCVKVDPPKIGKDHASVTTYNEWRSAEGNKILNETRTIHLYPVGDRGNLIVLDVDLSATVAPITFADTKEGSMGVRVLHQIRVDRGKGKLVNAEGKEGEGKQGNRDKQGCWGLVSAWCDYSGPIDGDQQGGISIFADPKNPINSCWHARNYGLLAANPFGRNKHARFPDRAANDDLVKIAKGESLKLRFGVYAHSGDVNSGKVASTYERFVELAGKEK